MEELLTPTWIYSAATVALAVFALVTATFAYMAWRQTRKQVQLVTKQAEQSRHSSETQLFSALLTEIATDEASKHRGIVLNEIKTGCIKEMKVYVEAVRKRENNNNACIGEAAERTIARLDRVGFFLLGKSGEMPTMDVPEWLWTIFDRQYSKLGYWVTYRQTEKSDKEYYHRGYGHYFAKLAFLAKDEINKELAPPHPMTLEESNKKDKSQ